MYRRCLLYLLVMVGSSLSVPVGSLFAQSDQDSVSASPKSPWGNFSVEKRPQRDPWWVKTLLWIPNRVLDFVDIFHIDLGVGMSTGGVVRVTRYGQLGYRTMHPASVRVGVFGRQLPVLLERSSEYGVGPKYTDSYERSVCPGEIGAGADLTIVGGYGGICVDEIADFVAGLVFIDLKDDDIQ